MSQIKKYITNFKAVLAVDFDGTIHTGEYPQVGPERNEAGLYLRILASEGYGIIINTCREGISLAYAINWLDNNGIPYHYVNCNFPHLIEEYSADCRKISADVYIDDKCLMGLPEWATIYNIINKKYG